MDADRLLFADTNVFVAATDAARPDHARALEIVRAGRHRQSRLAMGSQVVREYLSVSTRPAERNGLGLEPREALENVAAFRRVAILLDETPAVLPPLRRSVRRYSRPWSFRARRRRRRALIRMKPSASF